MQSVLVTGGTGFLGGFLIRRLLAEGYRTCILARPTRRVQELENLSAKVVLGDLTDEESIRRAVRGMDFVFHCAAKVNTKGSRAEFFECNVAGTERVFDACLQQRVGRVVYISSIGVYGLPEKGQPITEDTPYDAAPDRRGPYSHTKILADQFVVGFARKTSLSVVLLRPGLIYGPGRPLPLGLLAFQRGNLCVVVGKRNCRIPLNYVENVVDAVLLAAKRPEGGLRQFNVVDEEELTLERYYRVRTSLEGTRPIFLPGWPFYLAAPFVENLGRVLSIAKPISFTHHQLKRALQDVQYDTRRIRVECGWRPRVSLEEGVQRTIRSQEFLLERGKELAGSVK